MKKNSMKLLALTFSALLTGLLVMGGLSVPARAVDGAPGQVGAKKGVLAKIAARGNNQVSQGEPILPQNKGVHVFSFTDNTATLVLDETGTTPVAGQLNYVMISSGPASASCYLNVYDSGVASDTTEAASTAEQLVPPVMGVTSQLTVVNFAPPVQFQNGLVGLMDGACRMAVLGWTRIGGPQ